MTGRRPLRGKTWVGARAWGWATPASVLAIASCSAFGPDDPAPPPAAPIDASALPDTAAGVAPACPIVTSGVSDGTPPPAQQVCVDGGLPADLSGNPRQCGACTFDCKDETCESGLCTPKPSFYTPTERSLFSPAPIGAEIWVTAFAPGQPVEIRALSETGAVRTVATFQAFTVADIDIRGVHLDAALSKAVFMTTKGIFIGDISRPEDGLTAGPAFDAYAFAATATDLYFPDASTNTISKFSKVTGEVSDFGDQQDARYNITADAEAVYWASEPAATKGSHAQIRRRLLTGKSIGIVLADVEAPAGLLTDGGYLYFGNAVGAESRLERTIIGGGPRETLAVWTAPEFTPAGLVGLFSDEIVWLVQILSSGRFSILRVPRCGGPPRLTLQMDHVAGGSLGADRQRAYWVDNLSSTMKRGVY